MKHAVHSITTTACSISCFENWRAHVEPEDRVGKFLLGRPSAVPAGLSKDNIALELPSKYSRSHVHLGGDLAKRKYEDMTSCRIQEDGEAENDHELSCKLTSFRANKKRRPPEAGNLMQFQENTAVQVQGARGEEELQARTAVNTRRSRSGSRVAVTPDICGESDLTAENHMAEESSRSSNNYGSSMFESAADSVSKGSNAEFRSVSSLGFRQHYFVDHRDGGREIRVATSGQGPSHFSNLLAKNDAHDITRHLRMQDTTTTGGHQLGSVSGEVPSSVTNTVPPQLWGRSNQEHWLQLGVGSSPDPAASLKKKDPTSEALGKPPSFGQCNEERIIAKRKNTTSIDFRFAGDGEADSNVFSENSNVAPVHRQFRRTAAAMPSNFGICSDPLSNRNTATIRSGLTSGLMKNVSPASETVPQCDFRDTDLYLFGSSIPTVSARPEIALTPPCGPVTGRLPGYSASKHDKANARKSQVIEDSFESYRNQEDVQDHVVFPARNTDFGNSGVERSEVFNRAAPPFGNASTSVPATDIQFRLAQAAGPIDHDAFQFHRDNRPCSLSALMQTREDLRHGQAGYSWLSPPATDSAPKLLPVAKNFQGWSASDLTSTTKLAAQGAHHGGIDRHLNPVDSDQQARRSSDEWGSLFRKVSPNMLFPSQCQLPDGASSSLPVQSTSQEKNVGSQDAQENLVALKRAIENIQKRPHDQWATSEALNLGTVASWCMSKNLPGVRSDLQLESLTGDRPGLMPSMSTERVPVHSRFAAGPESHTNLSGRPPQRQSWQPAPGLTKLHHGPNVNMLQRASPPNLAKSKSKLLPPGSRGTNHAGLWFILQSAENQNGDGGRLPQISKAYLRIKDGTMPVSAVKKYLVTKLGLTSESEVEITCKGQPVVPSLPLQHVRDVIWFSSLNANVNNKEQTSSGERDESVTTASEHRGLPPSSTPDRAAAAVSLFSKDILMVLTYRRHPRPLQISSLFQDVAISQTHQRNS